ncbi:MAG: GNAT family protein [Nitrospirae bacterium]|nr:GNAT family protein [Nitrospirota bacterium]
MTQGKKVYLRPFSSDDIPIWSKWFNDLAVVEHMNKGAFPNTDEQQSSFFLAMSESRTDVQFAIALQEENTIIGTVGIHKIDWIHRHGSVSLMIGDKVYWGRGIASEVIGLTVRHAFTKLNLNRLTAGMWSSNLAAKKSFERNGFRLEGTLKGNYFYKDQYVDEWVMGLLRNNWSP